MSNNPVVDQAIALTGVWQALDLVHELAKSGQLDVQQRKRFDASINSMFNRLDGDQDNPARIFGGVANLEYALHGFALQLEQVAKRHQVTAYMVQILALQKRVAGNADLTSRIANRVGELDRQRAYFAENHSQLLSHLADLYIDTLGSLPMHQRIKIYGKGEQLQNQTVQQSIRALLLAAVRAAMLWQQLGGNRMLLLFQRKRIIRELYKLSDRV